MIKYLNLIFEVNKMIRNKLSDLLGERQMKISKLSLITGIARSTLTPIYFNQSEMIKIETINKICIALNISVDEFFESVNFDINFSYDDDAIEDIFINVMSNEDGIWNYNIDIGALCEIKEQNSRHVFDVKFIPDENTQLDDSVFFIQENSDGNGFWSEASSNICYNMEFENNEDRILFDNYIDQLSVGMKLILENKTKDFIRNILLEKFKKDESNQLEDVPKQKLYKLFKQAKIEILYFYI